MIKLRFFARFREQLDCESDELEAEGLPDVAALLNELRTRGGVWHEVFAEDQTVMLAVNQELADTKTTIRDGDEVAFFPPVTGG